MTTESAGAAVSPGRSVSVDTPPSSRRDVSRRAFLGWVLAAPVLVAAAPMVAADAVVPSPPEPADGFDLGDAAIAAAQPTANLISITIGTDGIARFALPRAEVGQGITTSTAMIVAEELDLPLSQVEITLADARPELVFNQLTAGSTTTQATYNPVRVAAALARGRLLDAAAAEFGVASDLLSTVGGYVHTPDGRSLGYGDLTARAAASTLTALQVTTKAPADFTLIGTPQNRVDAYASVTGTKRFAMDLDVPGAQPTMICRAPTIGGTPKTVSNLATVRAMPGVLGVATVSTGVAVRAQTFGQCIDAVRALQVAWNPGTAEGKSDASVLRELNAAELPMLPSVSLPIGVRTVDRKFTFHFRSTSPLETNCAVASYDPAAGIEVWTSTKAPITLQEELAAQYLMPLSRVKVHVVEGGGSFGRRLFSDAAKEAVEAARAFAAPVRLMWHRTDDFRHGRAHPMCTSHVKAYYGLGNVLAMDQRHTSVTTDFAQGFGEILTAAAARLPAGDHTLAQLVFLLTTTVPYNYGPTTQVIDEADSGFNTSSMRSIYASDVCTAIELVTDELADVARTDRLAFRRQYVKDVRGRAVLDVVARIGQWGRALPAGVAQGVALHNEYKGWAACLVEIDTRPATVNRRVPDAYTGPRVTKAVFAVDVGMPVNPRGIEAQIQGGIMDGIAQALTSSLHLVDGAYLEGSWDNYWFTRQWNVPPDIRVVVMPKSSERPGGAGEFGVAAAMAAVACAYRRATGVTPTEFPVNHAQPLGFTPLPTAPPVPPSPTNGLDHSI